jgi:hypothetical protein
MHSKDFECGVPTIRIDNLSTHLVTLAQQMYGEISRRDIVKEFLNIHVGYYKRSSVNNRLFKNIIIY